MTPETLEEAIKIKSKLEELKINLHRVNYMNIKDVVDRKSYLEFMGVEGRITIPETLFKKLGKMLQKELEADIAVLEDKLAKL